MIDFDWWWAFAALPLPWLLHALLPPAPVAGAVALPIAGELRRLTDAAGESGRWLLPWLTVLAWLLLVTAAAQPRWTGDPVQLPASGRDLLLAVDVSGSMGETDMSLGAGRVARLSAVQSVAGEFIERREGDRVGLVLFGRQAYLYAPLSLDRPTVTELLRDASVGLAGKETAIGDALAIGIKHLREAASSDKVLILLTDGVNTAGRMGPDKAAELAASANVRVHTIGFGDDSRGGIAGLLGMRRAQIDEAQLQRIASVTGGRYFRARSTDELESIYELLDAIEPVDVDTRTFRPSRSLFHWPLAAAVLLLALHGLRRRGWA